MKGAAIVKVIELCLPLIEKMGDDILPLIEKLVMELRKKHGISSEDKPGTATPLINDSTT